MEMVALKMRRLVDWIAAIGAAHWLHSTEGLSTYPLF